MFLRGVGACPWAKGLWLDGLALLTGAAPPKELAEYLEIAKWAALVFVSSSLSLLV